MTIWMALSTTAVCLSRPPQNADAGAGGTCTIGSKFLYTLTGCSRLREMPRRKQVVFAAQLVYLASIKRWWWSTADMIIRSDSAHVPREAALAEVKIKDASINDPPIVSVPTPSPHPAGVGATSNALKLSNALKHIRVVVEASVKCVFEGTRHMVNTSCSVPRWWVL